MGQFINSIRDVKANYKIYDGWEQAQADEKARSEQLAKTVAIPNDKVELTTAKAKSVIRATEMMDKRSEDNCENTEQVTGILSMAILTPLVFALNTFTSKAATSVKNLKWILPLQLGFPLLASAGLIIWANKKQKEASRIGRFQAKQNELNDAKNFVAYTPEQIEAAKIVAKNYPDQKDKDGIIQSFKELKQMTRDEKEYKKWLEEKIKNPDDIEKLLKVKFSPEQIEQGKQDKKLIVNIVKDINIKAEEYSENTENVFDTINTLSGLLTLPLIYGFNKGLGLIKSCPKMAKNAISIAVPLLFNLGVMMWGTQEQKESSRVGRFKARQELLENPKALMEFSQDQKNSVQDVKAPKQETAFFKKLGQNFKFLGTYLKDKKEYKKYKETTRNENEKLHQALLETKVSDKQLKEAKHLQEKVFFAFDEVDEMSQRYSEDVEAGTEIAKSAVGSLWTVGSMGALALAGIMFAKGKMPIHKIIKGVSNIALDKTSGVRDLINKAYKIINNDKTLKHEFNSVFQHGFDTSEMTNLMANKELAPLITEFQLKIASKLPRFAEGKNAQETIKEIVDKHFKKGPVAKWLRNLTVDVGKLWTKSKLPKEKLGATPELAESLKYNYKNYKTLVNTGVISAVPILGTIFAVPYAFNSWLTNVQKKAGKIGIMKAMDNIDKPEYFVNQHVQPETVSVQTEPQTTSLLNKFKK